LTAPDRFAEGIAAFNRRRFFECHEILEPLWLNACRAEEKAFYQGLIQLAVVGYKIHTEPNFVGARNKMRKALKQLTPLCGQSPWTQWIDLDQLVSDSAALEARLLSLGAAGFHTLDTNLFPRIEQPQDRT